ncbi:class F sortase [Streptomyces sp. NPDC056479]|uniref:class F sortase n=1 Tax=Streptomyces sp. NPDC056479 TaxID=3345832 RepID=UPI0036C38E73
MADHERPAHGGRLLMGVAWTVLLLGLWLWGREVTEVRPGGSAQVSGDIAAVGRPASPRLPPAARPLGDALPLRLDIPVLDLRAPVAARGLDAHGAIDPPPYAQAGVVGWYAAGVKPGAPGAALMTGHVDTRSTAAVFHRLGTLRPGATLRVLRGDGRVAEFTVDDVRVVPRDRFDAHQAYGAHRTGRAELRLITCAGTFDRATGGYPANLIVSAYLTGTGTGP